jgi:hypothetical protein
LTAKAVPKLILSLCDFSGRWSQPYRDAGYDVMQIDLKLGKDARLLKKLDRKVHGILAAPVCTEFSAAGARHWAAKEAAGNQGLLDGLALVDACLRVVSVHNPEWWVMENPVGRLQDWIGNHRCTFQPNEYAGYLGDEETGNLIVDPDDPAKNFMERRWMEDAYTKRTCLWGKFNIPKKDPRPAIYGSKMWSQYGGKSDRTKEMRSMTPRGFSIAFKEANP